MSDSIVAAAESARRVRRLVLPGSRAWAVIALFTLYHELRCAEGELLSEAVDRAIIRHPVLTRLLFAVIMLHLNNWIPTKLLFLDPFHQAAVLTKHLVNR
ncbi:hypothetical protein SEA_LOZINAK_149 [Gordonia phage Lozinak]|uniref:Uncharacterized protein n=4 Tax=Smoothievirus TaxID=1982557 RepID=A0A2D1GG03_9CAUD|nr:hypothetical protein BEN60_gp057 [Gordonia phage Smoothie]YP_009276263.1 hypothetical protein BH772_gp059 [Gordonia phage Bachita]YP_009281302.1 hypothetical protein BIZ74_gp057 [Gordonia phage Cucurbita]ATN90775.1 hypothetical protein SEA_LOZINAK_149 [Gordonia phage Lozinak]AUE23655.1 hypothetical protein SEA_TONIANN_149 [Gordonia phage Toniann]QAU07011.1 hypothetical protein SEA_APHELION_148 [Gordonia phage Aphelion]QKY79725.1 hypothetical protein SEA_ENGINEER_151 [Gordonia Phage Enginee